MWLITLAQRTSTVTPSVRCPILDHACVHVCTLKDEDGEQLDISVPCPLSKGGFLDFLSSFSFISSVTQFCPALRNRVDCGMPAFPVLHQLPELGQIHVHSVGDAIQTSHPVIPFSPHLQSFPASGSFPMSQFFTSGGQSTAASASASVLPMNIQNWSPLGWTGWISLQSKGLSRAFSSTTVQKHQFFGTQLSLYYTSHIHTWLLEKP